MSKVLADYRATSSELATDSILIKYMRPFQWAETFFYTDVLSVTKLCRSRSIRLIAGIAETGDMLIGL